jgi:hypothetical protein
MYQLRLVRQVNCCSGSQIVSLCLILPVVFAVVTWDMGHGAHRDLEVVG